ALNTQREMAPWVKLHSPALDCATGFRGEDDLVCGLNSQEQLPAALCRDAATPEFMAWMPARNGVEAFRKHRAVRRSSRLFFCFSRSRMTQCAHDSHGRRTGEPR